MNLGISGWMLCVLCSLQHEDLYRSFLAITLRLSSTCISINTFLTLHKLLAIPLPADCIPALPHLQLLTLAALDCLPTSVLFVMDLTEECGTSVQEQWAIRQEVCNCSKLISRRGRLKGEAGFDCRSRLV